MRTSHAIAFILPFAGLATAALAHGEGDIGLLWDGSSIVTSIADDEDGLFEDLGERVFAGELEELFAGGPIAGDGPGFFTTDGPTNTVGAFGTGWTIGYNTRAALREWTGSGFGATSAVLGQDQGGTVINTPTTDQTVPGFEYIYSGGDFDEHPDYLLTGAAGPGAFLWELEFYVEDASGTRLDTTESLYVVFNYGLDEADHEAAIEYVEEFIVPAPSSALALGSLGLISVRRRRTA